MNQATRNFYPILAAGLALADPFENGLGPPKRKLAGRNPIEKLRSLAHSIENLSPAQKQLLLKILKLP